MKLTTLKIRDRLDQPAKSLFSEQEWDMNMEGPLVTMTNLLSKDTFIVPLSNVVYCRPAPRTEPKK